MDALRIADLSYVWFTAPDLGAMRAFLEDFGMSALPESDAETLYMRGSLSQNFIHMTRRGEPGFGGVAVLAGSVDALHRFAQASGAPVRPCALPGGGEECVLVDPDGYQVTIVAGRQGGAAGDLAAAPGWNDAQRRGRVGAVKRVPAAPSQIVRLGHIVLGVSDFRRSEQWWKAHFGLLTSDEIQLPDGMALGAFLRCDRGPEPTDHHTVFLAQLPGDPAFHHAAFEVRDVDDLMAGHDHLQARNHRPAWGVGRHLLGSQVFDYWLDPWGHQLEHWTDGDLFTAADAPNVATLEELMGVQWGAASPEHG